MDIYKIFSLNLVGLSNANRELFPPKDIHTLFSLNLVGVKMKKVKQSRYRPGVAQRVPRS